MGAALPLILQIIQLAAGVATPILAGNKEATAINQASADLASIVAAALAAHQQITGQPLDLTQLQPITPVP